MDQQDAEPNAGVEKKRHFLPRQSRASWLMAFVLGLVLLPLAFALLGAMWQPQEERSMPSAWVLGTTIVLCVMGVVYFVRRAASRQPVLTLSRSGIESPQLDAPIPWHRVDDAVLTQHADHAVLQLHLQAPAGRVNWSRSGWWRRHPLAPRVHLSRLSAQDQLAAYATLHAYLAPWRRRAGLGEAPSLAQARAAMAWAQRLHALTPVPWALYGVMVLNLLVWALGAWEGWDLLAPAPVQLFAWGGNSASAVTLEGQYWRLLSASLLHAGGVHLLLNLCALWVAGRQVCRWFGNLQFLLIYLASALVGSAVSLHFSAQQAISVGSSGAVLGVLGALLVAAWQHRDRWALLVSKPLWFSQAVLVAYLLLLGLGRPDIDNAAHLGGLLAGGLMASLLVPPIHETVSRLQRQRRQALGWAGVALLVTGLVWSTPTPQRNHRQSFEVQAVMTRVLPQIQAAEQAVQQDMQAFQAGQRTEAELAQALVQQHIPAYLALREAMAPLSLPTSDPLYAWLTATKRMNVVLTVIMELEVRKFLGEEDPQAIEVRQKALADELAVLAIRLQDSAPKNADALPR